METGLESKTNLSMNKAFSLLSPLLFLPSALPSFLLCLFLFLSCHSHALACAKPGISLPTTRHLSFCRWIGRSQAPPAVSLGTETVFPSSFTSPALPAKRTQNTVVLMCLFVSLTTGLSETKCHTQPCRPLIWGCPLSASSELG